MSRPLARLVALLAVLALALAACGDDDTESEPPDTTEAAAPTDDTEAPDTTEAPETTVTEPAGGDVPLPAGVPTADELVAIDDACELIAVFDELGEALDVAFDDLDGAGVAAVFGYIQVLYQRGAEVAPPEVEDDFAYIAASIDEFIDFMAAYDFDLDALERLEQENPEVVDDLMFLGEGFFTSDASIASWAETEC